MLKTDLIRFLWKILVWAIWRHLNVTRWNKLKFFVENVLFTCCFCVFFGCYLGVFPNNSGGPLLHLCLFHLLLLVFDISSVIVGVRYFICYYWCSIFHLLLLVSDISSVIIGVRYFICYCWCLIFHLLLLVFDISSVIVANQTCFKYFKKLCSVKFSSWKVTINSECFICDI